MTKLYICTLESNYKHEDTCEQVRPRLEELFKEIGYTSYRFPDETGYQNVVILEEPLVLTAEQFMMFQADAKVNLEVKTTLNLAKLLPDQLTRVHDKQLLPTPSQDTYNNHCEVHIPGFALSTYNDTLLLEDSCTDVLQDALDKGWRIIACCPQAQRRPDYILGRFNPDTSLDRSAKRSNQI